MKSTTPAPFESVAFIPPTARLTGLAKAALSNGCSPDDVAAYLTGRAAYLSQPYRLVQVAIECLGSGAVLS